MTTPAPSADTHLDLSPLWASCHGHLQPLHEALPLQPDQHHACPGCGGHQALSLVAHLRFGAATWREGALVDYCPDCGRFLLPRGRLDDYRRELALAPDAMPTAVDARLWSRTPTFLNIEPTTRCNFSCWYCVGRHMRQEDITIENFVQALDNFPAVRTIALVGEGEPLMHTGFFEMARIAAARGIRVVLSSNGSTLSSANVRKLCESKVAYVSVSIDSDDPGEFAASRADGKLDQVLAGIRRLVDYRDQNGYAYPRIGLKGTLFSATRDRTPRIVAAAKAAGADIFEGMQVLNPMRTYVPIYPQEQLGELAHVDAVATCASRDQAGALEELRGIASFCAEEGIAGSNIGRRNGLRPNCDEEWVYALLSGDVTPCCQVKTPIDPRWNLFRTSMDEILADRHYENIRFNLWNGLFPDYCMGCWKTRG